MDERVECAVAFAGTVDADALCGGGALLRLLLRLGLLRIVPLERLEHARIGEEAMHAVRRGGALRNPSLRLVEIELDAVGVILGQQRIVEADLLDEAAVARKARIRDDDRIMRPLLGAAPRQSDFQSHVLGSFCCSE